MGQNAKTLSIITNAFQIWQQIGPLGPFVAHLEIEIDPDPGGPLRVRDGGFQTRTGRLGLLRVMQGGPDRSDFFTRISHGSSQNRIPSQKCTIGGGPNLTFSKKCQIQPDPEGPLRVWGRNGQGPVRVKVGGIRIDQF